MGKRDADMWKNLSKVLGLVFMGCCVVLLLAVGVASPALAETGAAPSPENTKAQSWEIFAGVGTVVHPEFPGSSSYNVTPIPFGEIRYQDRFFLNAYYGIGGRLFEKKFDEKHSFSLSASLRYGFANRDEDDDPRFAGLGEVDNSIEVMMFANYRFGDWNVGWEGAKALNSGGHEGISSTLYLEYIQRLFGHYMVRFGPFASFGDGNYMQTFYGITDDQAARSVFETFSAGAGIEKLGLRANLLTFFSRRVGFFALANYSHLVGDAGKSPLIDSKNQFMSLAGVVYRF
ncbi:MipA/OmpV family protein [Luteithermobacter gelatinilyticus]|uniref:MipA/OmpV family protein n=1 Tax=Luteithermobacter gelatinilyticus TaxID=2582913 RepID=UPI0011075C51|nr:MipA/OmpV family protein [Luteithermobacter gelatinilyticus]